jgi:hypothetical protein
MPNSQTHLDIEDNDIKNKKKENINKKEELICNYSKELVKQNGDINRAKKKIEEFKKQLLTDTSIIEGKITALNKAISNTEFTDDLEEKNREFKKVAGKVLSGTQLKQDVYEENTNLTMHLLYYILGMGFMGYYIIKLLKK